MKQGFVRNPKVKLEVIAAVIAAVVVGVLGTTWDIVVRWIPTIKAGMNQAASLALQTSSIPNWVLCISTVAVAGFVFLPSLLLWRRLALEPSRRLRTLAYTTDDFFGIRWTWKYNRNSTPINFRPFCLRCGDNLYFETNVSYDDVKQITYRCDKCGWHHSGLKKTKAELDVDLRDLATLRGQRVGKELKVLNDR